MPNQSNMSPSQIRARIAECRSVIAANNRALDDPYEQNKWVEREQNERLQREIAELEALLYR